MNSKISVILVDPEKPRNIGFVARAMKVNGLADLQIVSDRFPKMHSAAYITGTAGSEVLDEASFYTDLSSVLKGFTYAIAFSRRNFEFSPDEFDLGEIHARLPQNGKVALVFGRESKGLNGEEMAQCSAVCSIPTESGMSYNLGQAVSIAMYELFGSQRVTKHSQPSKIAPAASIEEKEALLKAFLEAAPRLEVDKRRSSHLKRLFERRVPSRREIKLLFGLLKEIKGSIKN